MLRADCTLLASDSLLVMLNSYKYIDRSFCKNKKDFCRKIVVSMEVKRTLALPEGLEVTGIEMTDEVLTIMAVSAQMQPSCPLCGTPATRVHSHYTRKIADLPFPLLLLTSERLAVSSLGSSPSQLKYVSMTLVIFETLQYPPPDRPLRN